MNKEQALGMEKIAKGPFAPIYPAMAKELIEKSQKKNGVCLDIGGGGGQLGLNIKALTNMEVVNLDINPFTIDIAIENAKEMGQTENFQAIAADVQALPMENDSIDLCVSRGSYWFWEDRAQGFREIKRVLKKDGIAIIGCGFVSNEILQDVIKKMATVKPEWNEMRINMFKNNPVEDFKRALIEAGIDNFVIEEYSHSRWIIIRK
jgi:ubiquinone/menaquinone biosynthesis C-methylase UbiE